MRERKSWRLFWKVSEGSFYLMGNVLCISFIEYEGILWFMIEIKVYIFVLIFIEIVVFEM